jgi:DNA-binding transcriptional LysR family regulator
MDWADRIGRRIRLRDLHIVLAVAERGSMAKAAEHLAISHPVVSKTISDLEQTVGVRLFDRNSQGVELTTYGRALLKCGVTVFDEMRQGLKQIEFLAHPDSGELAIGCSDITMAGLLPAIAERFSIQHPGIRLHVIHADTAMLQFHALRERNVELLIGRMPRMSVNDDLVVETLFDEPFVVVCGIRSRWARRRNIALADLVNAPWILPPYDSVPGSLILEIFRANKMQPPRARLVTLSGHLTATLIGTGRFVGLLPSSVARFSASRAGLRILATDLPAPRVATAIITVKNRTLSPLAELFIDSAREITTAITGPTKRRKSFRNI